MAAPPDAVPSRPHRRWPRRLLIGLNIFVAICIVGVGSGYAYLRWRFNQIDTIDFGPGTGGAEGDQERECKLGCACGHRIVLLNFG